MMTPTRIGIPAKSHSLKPKLGHAGKPDQKPKPRDELARPLASMLELGAFVRNLRTGLSIQQAELATRAKVSRQWIVALEQGQPTLRADKVLRTLQTLGFELAVSPYDPPPPWMLRATATAEAKQKALAAGRRTRRNTRRAKARELRLANNEPWVRADVE